MQRYTAVMQTLLDTLVPFGPFLRKVDQTKRYANWQSLLLRVLPVTFFMHWLFGFIPVVGPLMYSLLLVPLSAWLHIRLKEITSEPEKYRIYLWYFVVIVIGFGSLRGFIGHFFLSDMVASGIGWETGSPFQIELAFYHLGIALAALGSIWRKEEFWIPIIIVISVFLSGAAYVHIADIVLNNNVSPLNTGSVLIGDIVLPTVFLYLLYKFKSAA